MRKQSLAAKPELAPTREIEEAEISQRWVQEEEKLRNERSRQKPCSAEERLRELIPAFYHKKLLL